MKEHWLYFEVHKKGKTLNRQEILSLLSSIYNPIELASPFMLDRRIIIRSLFHKRSDWNEQISDNMASKKWSKVSLGDRVIMKKSSYGIRH